MSAVERGRAAEEEAAAYLQARGFKILRRNWRTRWHEVDIVARQSGGLHFIEVKYRRTVDYGSGFDYVNPEKARRLRRAALAWVQACGYGGDYQIDVISVSGPLENPHLEYIPNAVQEL